MSNDEGTRSTLPPDAPHACTLCGGVYGVGRLHSAIECAWRLRERVKRMGRVSVRARVAARS